jgi:3-dehydroquinate synthase
MPTTTTALRIADAFPLPRGNAALGGRVHRTESYPVHVLRDLGDVVGRLAELAGGRSVAIITDETVESLYGGPVLRGLRQAGVETLVHTIPEGESSKSLGSAVRLWDELAESRLARRDLIVNLGGGVVADLGGWVASGYMRGVPYVNVPTTLLAQVDGALGGKVAVNHRLAKNLLGAFHQPAAVISGITFLASVGGRHLRAGLAESIKKAVIASPAYFRQIEDDVDAIVAREPSALERLVRAAVAIKCALIERDPFERDLRRPLNFGHTVGHPLETVTGYGPLLHGEAVAFGMVVEARIALERGLLDSVTFDRLVALLERCALPTAAGALRAPVDVEAVLEAMEKVRLIRAGSLRCVLPVRLGETEIADDVTEEEIRSALAACAAGLVPTVSD